MNSHLTPLNGNGLAAEGSDDEVADEEAFEAPPEGAEL